MRLVNSEIEFEIELQEDCCQVIYVENASLFSNFVESLWNQAKGEVGSIILSEKDKELSISKEAELIINPFDISCNSKKILSKLYQETTEIVKEEYFDRIVQLNQSIVNLLDDVSSKLPYHLDYNFELNIEEVLKIYNYQLESEGTNLIERIIDYIKVSHQVLRRKIYFFINLKSYLSDNEIKELFEFALYEKIYLVLIESSYKSLVQHEKGWIIDQDICIIELNELTALSQCNGSAITSFEV